MKVSTALSKTLPHRGLLGLLPAVLLEVGVFPTIVDSLVLEVMSVEVGGSGGCHVMDLGCVRRVSCDGLGMVGQGDVM